MGKYLDFEKDEKGYKPFVVNKDNVRANIGNISVEEFNTYFERV